ncbi:glycosyltransferase family 2 protein [Dolichospermum sp. ST_sed3]|nr:glycosyltransferase family 2 protein [Dolichospermum sp. ST_sed3]
MSKVSVIIPCYNMGQFLDEAVDSVLNQTFQNLEIIIINDGSTDEITIDKLENYIKPKTKVIHTPNQGVSLARNIGIQEAIGEYILPLDADDKIHPEYIYEAINILDNFKEIGIVYCDAAFFYEKNEIWEIPEFSLEKILADNLINCCAFFRKEDFLRTSGYNSNMKYGLEDWDFWLSLLELDLKVYKIPKILFYYRIKNSSRNIDLTNDEDNLTFSHQQIYYNHKNLYNKYIESPIHLIRELNISKNELQYWKNKFEVIENSYSYRIGNRLVRPFSKLKKMFNA